MSKRPNLLYVFLDQWRYHAMGYTGIDPVSTPHMDAFASESLDCKEAVSTFPLCSPHRASLLTGKYPFSVGMWTNCKIGLSEVLMLRPQEVCIGNVLKDHGYHTGYIGKWHLDASEQNFEKNPVSGAKDWDAYTPPGERRQGFDYWLSYGACDNHLDPHYWADTPEQIKPGCWSPEFETDKALEYMEGQKDSEEPFALFVSYNPPHLPYELVPDKYYKQYEHMPVHFRENVPEEKRTPEMETITRQYYAAVTGVDEQFGRILEYLKANHMEEDTLVVLSADHGEMLGSHGRMSKNVWYEESVHIPLYLRWKGQLAPAEYKELLASPDHMPTLLGLLDIPVPDTCQGFDHAACIRGEADNAPQDAFLCSYPGMPDMVAEFEKRGMNSKCYGWRGIRTHRYTYVVNNGYAPGEQQVRMLYDNEKDPYQMNPLMITEENRDLVKDYDTRLREYLDLQQDPFLL
nr:sulfatase [uncultured Blautia sp.]